jgi:hypothetical protein
MTLQANKRALTSLLLTLITASIAQKAGSAVEQFQSLQGEPRKSRTAGDWHSNLVSAKILKELLNEAPDSLLEVARADVHVGAICLVGHHAHRSVRQLRLLLPPL